MDKNGLFTNIRKANMRIALLYGIFTVILTLYGGKV